MAPAAESRERGPTPAAGPLAGIRVVEAGIWAAAPSAGAILADWGADVVKIEDPRGGDPLRGLLATGLVPFDLALNPPFQLDNRGKRSVSIDLRHEEGGRLARTLVARADVFVTNLRTAVLARLGLDAARLCALNRRLIYAGLTGYGTRGPERDRAAFDYSAFWARAGVMASLGEPEGPPPTQRPGMGDHMTGLGLAGAVAAALFARERTGHGQEIQTSLFQTGLWMAATDLQVCLQTGLGYTPVGRQAAPNPLFNYYRTADGKWLHLVMLQPDRHWADFCRAIGREDLGGDPRFADVDARRCHSEALIAILDQVIATRSLEEWSAAFDRHNVYWGRIQAVAEVAHDPQAQAIDAFVQVPHPAGEVLSIVASPVTFRGTPASIRDVAPELGQHTEEVLLEIGYTWDDIARLRETGAIG